MAMDMVGPQPPLVALLVRHVLLPREFLPQIEIKSSKYGLFFITHNILGAEKFLDAQEKLKRVIENSHIQMSFNFVDVSDKTSIAKYMKKAAVYDNTELYKLGIMTGLLPKEVTQQLRQLERDGKLIVSEITGKKRNNRGLYIGYKQYRNVEKVVTLRLAG